MITGTGKGGEALWGGHLDDEFHPDLKVIGVGHVWCARSTDPAELPSGVQPMAGVVFQHDRRGIVSMANNGPNTIGSQFFITYGRQNHLNNVYTVIGRYVRSVGSQRCSTRADLAHCGLLAVHGSVIHGMEVLDSLEKVPVSGKKHRPDVDIKLERVTIHANPFAT